MAFDSSTGGYLLPVGQLDTDQALEDTFQRFIVGVTGLPETQVRPRWQAKPPPMPDAATPWCALGVQRVIADANGYIAHRQDNEGTDRLIRHETLEVLATFYGHGSQDYALRCRDALWIAQNREALMAQGIAFISVGALLNIPEQVNQQWLRRYDLNMTFRRRVERSYPILNLRAAPLRLDTDTTL